MTSITNIFKEKAKRLHFLLTLICFSFPCYADQSKPNVILFLTDDMGWGDAAVLGHPYLKTPNIDRFAREGSMYRNFHTNSGVGSPVALVL